MVTVETAIAIPVVLAMAGIGLWGLTTTAAAVALSDAGRTAARDLARGASHEYVHEQLRERLPDINSEIEVRDDVVIVRVHRFVTVPVPLLSGLGIDLRASFVAPLEWRDESA